MLSRVCSKPPGVSPHCGNDLALTVRTGRYGLLLRRAGLIGTDANAVGHTAVLRIADVMVHIELDLLADQRGSLGIAEQLTQRLAVGGINNERPHLIDTGHALLSKGEHILILLAALERDGAIPQAGNGQYRFGPVVNVLGAQILGIAHLPEAFIATKLAELILRHHLSRLPPLHWNRSRALRSAAGPWSCTWRRAFRGSPYQGARHHR